MESTEANTKPKGNPYEQEVYSLGKQYVHSPFSFVSSHRKNQEESEWRFTPMEKDQPCQNLGTTKRSLPMRLGWENFTKED
ncbi:unnamed protein product [Prunus armeniaca]